jgi:hypothetical protein
MLIIAFVALGSICTLQYKQLRAMQAMDEAVRIAWNLPRIREMTTSWISGGVTRSTTTAHQDNWTLAQWQDRHFNAVKADQVTYPPDN